MMNDDLINDIDTQANSQVFIGNQDVQQLSHQGQLRQRLFGKSQRKVVSEEEQKDVELKLSILESEIKKDIELYQKRGKVKGKGAVVFRLLTTALAAIVTVLLGVNLTVFNDMEYIRTPLGQPLSWYANTIAIIISAFLTVLGALRNFLDSNELWVLYTDTVNQLQQLLEDIQYLKIGFNYCTLDDINLLNLEYTRIKEEAENNRLRLRMDDYGKN
ncbi:MAG: SLATT domain-containing protein [Cytophagales bacterium]|nr:MAG: SLATT domain-containing protein [Cytophagales bacterium]